MSRFKNSNPSSATPFVVTPPPPVPVFSGVVGASIPPATPAKGLFVPPVSINAAQTIGYLALWLYLFSWAGYINEISLRNLGMKPYISFVAGPVVLLASIFSGSILRALQVKAGKFWLGLGVFVLLSTPFSVWRSDTAVQVINYIPRVYLILFFIGACAVTLKRCQWLIYANIIGGAILVLLCVGYGETAEGRFVIMRSSFENPNALALHLIVSGCFFTFLLFRRNIALRILGLIFLSGAMVYMLRTASRGSLLAALAIVVGLLVTVRAQAKLKIVVALFVLAVPAVITASDAALSRIVKIVWNPSSASDDAANSYAVSSQMARTELLRLSIVYSFTHPLFGVGLGQFGNAVYGDAEKAGRKENASAAGTHNSYTQVSSECGIPAAICYLMTLVLSISSNRRLYKLSRDIPAAADIAGMSLCLFMTSIGLAVNTFFYHIAFGYYVPTVAGLSIAVYLCAKPVLKQVYTSNTTVL